MAKNRETETCEFCRLWDHMSMVPRNIIAGEMHILAILHTAWSRLLNPPPRRRTWTIIQLQSAIIGASSMSDTQPILKTR